ncbi:MAG: MFS transporter, partial [Pseudobdellovibrionaceae bacterium]
INFTHIVDFMIMMPLGPQLMRLFSITPQQFGFLVSAYTLTAGFSGFLASFFIDRFDRKIGLLFFYTGFAFGTLACALADTYWVLLISRCVAGFFGGVLGSLIFSIVGDVISFERRGTAMGVVMMSFSLASVMGVPLSLYLANHYGWHSPFVFLGLLSLLVGVVIFLLVPPLRIHLQDREFHPTAKQAWGQLFSFFSEDSIRNSLIFAACLIFGQFTVIPFISPSLVANAGLTEAQLPLIYLCGGAFTIISSPLIGRCTDIYGKKIVFIISILLSILPLLLITHLNKNFSLPAILVTNVLFFMVMGGRMIPAMAMISEAVVPAQRGSFMSVVSSVQQLSSALAAGLAGFLVTRTQDGQLLHYNWVGYIAVAFSLLTLWLLSRMRSTQQEQKSKT